jgi:hypothetical protein
VRALMLPGMRSDRGKDQSSSVQQRIRDRLIIANISGAVRRHTPLSGPFPLGETRGHCGGKRGRAGPG